MFYTKNRISFILLLLCLHASPLVGGPIAVVVNDTVSSNNYEIAPRQSQEFDISVGKSTAHDFQINSIDGRLDLDIRFTDEGPSTLKVENLGNASDKVRVHTNNGFFIIESNAKSSHFRVSGVINSELLEVALFSTLADHGKAKIVASPSSKIGISEVMLNYHNSLSQSEVNVSETNLNEGRLVLWVASGSTKVSGVAAEHVMAKGGNQTSLNFQNVSADISIESGNLERADKMQSAIELREITGPISVKGGHNVDITHQTKGRISVLAAGNISATDIDPAYNNGPKPHMLESLKLYLKNSHLCWQLSTIVDLLLKDMR